MMGRDSQEKIDAYIGQLRQRLTGLPREQVTEIIDELHSHIHERAVTANSTLTTEGVEAALQSLGDPDDLAREYLTDAMLAQAQTARSPFHVLDTLFWWASMSIAGFAALLISVVGYFLGLVSLLVAASKPFHPRTAGLWFIPDGSGGLNVSLRLGFGPTSPAGGRDLLGWWIVPVGLVVGCGLVVLTAAFARWIVLAYRRWRLSRRGLPGVSGSDL